MLSSAAITTFIVIGIPVICGTIIAIVAILQGKSGDEEFSTDETKLLQEIHQGLSKLEQRIDALETIVISKERNHKHSEL
ncbi:hypothetical protein [Cerasicoccus frondis]|uniref:hypothetical protein n=1 Tax=Cerasicoccus frondis TaxID=490090 RepID=UPI002852AB61|nr:hypothetical protein [Cerasicoccus frondis]